MQCPKCGYVRKAEETAPEWQCPACQVVYAKASSPSSVPEYPSPGMNSHSASTVQAGSKLPSLKTIVTLALITFIGYYGYQFFSSVTITKETINEAVSASPITAPDKTVLLYSSTGCKYSKKAKVSIGFEN